MSSMAPSLRLVSLCYTPHEGKQGCEVPSVPYPCKEKGNLLDVTHLEKWKVFSTKIFSSNHSLNHTQM